MSEYLIDRLKSIAPAEQRATIVFLLCYAIFIKANYIIYVGAISRIKSSYYEN